MSQQFGASRLLLSILVFTSQLPLFQHPYFLANHINSSSYLICAAVDLGSLLDPQIEIICSRRSPCSALAGIKNLESWQK